MQGIQGIKAKDVMKYALLPGIIPRINAFIESGFGWLAFMMAVIYNSVKLLPNGHPYLNPQNMGQFGVRHVIAEAANNIVVRKENIDQIVIFIALLLGFVLLCLQFVAILFALLFKPAAAAAFAGIFATPSCTTQGQNANCTDIAFMMLDKVFGVPNMYNSKFAPSGTGFGNIPIFNRALQELFQYYNYAILIVGVVIFLYYVIVIVGETANTGTPFGRRFNHVYAPLRLVGAVGLLVPLNYGLNSAQYITLFAAKFGSGFATNAWIAFNQELSDAETPIGTHKESLIARPTSTDVTHIVSFMSIVQTCKTAFESRYANEKMLIRAYLPEYKVNDTTTNATEPLIGTDYQNALKHYANRDIVIVFGRDLGQKSQGEMTYPGNIEPTCGIIKVHTNVAGKTDGGAPDDQRIGAYDIQKAFYDIVAMLWGKDDSTARTDPASCPASSGGSKTTSDLINFSCRLTWKYVHIPNTTDCNIATSLPGNPCQEPDASFKTNAVSAIQKFYDGALKSAYNDVVNLGGGFYDIPQELLDRGWAGAAIWYNHIAEWNGGLFSAADNPPTPTNMPKVMEDVQEQRRSSDEAVDIQNRYEPLLASGPEAAQSTTVDMNIPKALNAAYKYWIADGRGQAPEMQTSGNVFFDLLNAVFGIGGLFTMRQNDDTHPLAQLSAMGKSIVESSVRNLMTALVFSAGGGMGEIVGLTHLGAALNSISSMFVAFTSIGLAVGFILYYVLPFLPFIYFYFAVGGWVKTIFEAMVGTPLWALAHLKVDGNGFPGDSASNGYFLIFEIFVRPILTVFGLIAGMAIFAALARTLNGIFDLVVENLTGFDCGDCKTGSIAGIEYKRNVIDEFFFTVIYTVLVYMLATSSFKMIDQVPNNILRWMGAGVQSFGDQRDDPAQGLVQYAAFGGANMAGQVSGALQTGARAAGQGIGLPFGLAGKLFSRNAPSAATGAKTGGEPPPGSGSIDG